MNQPVILLNSITYAIRAQKVLEQRGIFAHIRKVPAGGRVKSCGYGLEIKGDVKAAAALLAAAGIRIMDIIEP